MPQLSLAKGSDPILQGVPPKFTGLMERLENVRERLKNDHVDPTSERGHNQFMRQLDIYNSPSLLYANRKRPSSAPGDKTRGVRVSSRPNAQTINKRTRDSMSDHERYLTKIENQLLSYKQADRDLRKMEGELSTEQRDIQASLNRWDNERSSKQLERLRAQQENNRGIDRFMQTEVKGKSDKNKENISRYRDRIQRLNENRKKVTKLETEGEYRFKKLSDALEMKTHEIKQLSGEFEDRMRRKEEEQINLKKELTQIAIGLNRQHQEFRARDKNELKQSRSDNLRDIASSRLTEENVTQEWRQKGTRDAKIQKSQSAADVSISAKKDRLRGQGRRVGWDMVEVQLGLSKNLDQIQLLEVAKNEAYHNLLEASIEERLDAANYKKESRIQAATESLKERNAKAVQEWEKRANNVTREDGLKKREYAVRDLKKCVRAGDMMEQRAFMLARNRDQDKTQQMQLVEQLENDLYALKRDNTKKMKEIAMQTKKDEENMSQRLSRERAKLRKSWHARDEQLAILQQERSRNLEERYLLGEYQREQQRVERIVALSQAHQQQE
ncbi:Trichohyalin-like [Oopsacas minuta]|uniref:Trichohyalin-like n=1 Tax=Oopsacas minuta TaxID=111878 RepID=A0AAV7K9X5_9METZ|nr:Trichohyalin-like [Oopsacas minuta]